MRNLTTGIVRAAALLSLGAFGTIDAQQKVNVGHAAAPDISVRLSGDFEKIRITGWSRDSVSIIGGIPKGARLGTNFADAPDQKSRGAKMFVESDTKDLPGVGGVIELRVPAGARVWVKSGTTDVEATGITGELDINVLGGSVRVIGTQRVLLVEAIDATVVVDGSPAYVRLKTAEGDITMRGSSMNAAFNSVSGNIFAGEGTYDRARFDNVNGNVTFAGELARGAVLNLGTHSGTIEVQLAGKPSVVIDAATSNSMIENLLSKSAPTSGRDGRGQQINISLGNADSRITVETYKGHVRLMRR